MSAAMEPPTRQERHTLPADAVPLRTPQPDLSPPAPAPPTDSAQTERPTDAVRASHAEREETVAALHRALGEGRLDLDEIETRQSAAYAARYRDELPPLLADLPDTEVPAGLGTHTRAPSWTELFDALIWRLRAVVFGSDTARPDATQRAWGAVALGITLAWTLLWAVIVAVAVAA